MKVIVAVIFAIGSVSAGRSGPYLPSGWRPSGPAFYLPTEVQKPADNPLKDTLLFAPEASGSEGLREYGPPKEAFSVQTLPDVVTEQTFYVLDGSSLVGQLRETEVNVEQKTELIQEATTEAQIAEFKTQEFVTDVTATYEAVTDKIEDEVTQEVEIATENFEIATEKVEVAAEYVEVATDKAQIEEEVAEVKEVESVVAAAEEKLEKAIVEEQKLENIILQEKASSAKVVASVEGVKNIAEALVVIESEIKPEEVQQSIETVGDLKVNQEESEVNVPEGFLEYGPPGFREYGPPKGDEIKLVENEVRRRRFSPKFRSVNRKH